MESEPICVADGGAPRIAEECGLAHRFRYFVGISGRRYLFTAVSEEEIGDFSSGVVVLTEPARGGALVVIAVVPIGEHDACTASDRCGLRGDGTATGAYVHLLADSPAERHAIMADLSLPRQRLAA